MFHDYREEPHSADVEKLSEARVADLQADLFARLRLDSPPLDQPTQLAEALKAPDWNTSAAALYSLQGDRDPKLLPILLSATENTHESVRAAALHILGEYEEKAALKACIAALRDPSWLTREAAVHTLGKHGSWARKALQTALADSDQMVREAALQELQYIADRPATSYTFSISRQFATLGRSIAFAGLILRKQIPLIHRSVWLLTMLVMMFSTIFALVAALGFKQIQNAELVLAIASAICSASGITFIYAEKQEVGFDITLSTPTSIRLIAFCRFVLVVGYNMLLTGCAAAVLALFSGNGLQETIQLWLGPMLLLASISFAVSQILGSGFSIVLVCILEASRVFHVEFSRYVFILQLADPGFWRTNVFIVGLAILVFACAFFFFSDQPEDLLKDL